MRPLPPTTYPETLALLRSRLAGGLPGAEAQLTMAPAHRMDPVLASVAEKRCREAAVLALLYPAEEAVHLVLTVRRAHLSSHAGQISFPGGRREPGETLQQTALRETREEIGIPEEAVELLGALTPLYIPPSNFCVYPFVGTVPAPPRLTPFDVEVEAILHPSIPYLLSPGTRRIEPWNLRGEEVPVPFFDIDGHKVWGATAMMLAELLALMA